MTLKAFLFIVASALFHVFWNSSLKMCRDKTTSVFLMMTVTAGLLGGATLYLYPIKQLFSPSVITAALGAGFFFFLYQHFVALAYEKGDLTLVYPLTVTGPVYIVIWSYLLIGERITLTGAFGIFLIIYGAVTIHTGNFKIIPNRLATFDRKNVSFMENGVLFALAAAFFYSFGALADKIGVMTGNIMIYTFHLSLYMTLFHLLRIVGQHHNNKIIVEIKHNPVPIISGGIVMFFSFITFRIGLEHALVSYASALRQVSTLFGILIGFFIFREQITLKRVISSLFIVSGAVLIKLG
ncbi:MAG: EamA family transporter [Desulfamplus sp.]|nr:EamA family transporter [Desulfamplus sp.]